MTAKCLAFLQEKESLITELRKELGLSNEEHRELLSHVNADEVIRNIRSDKSLKHGFFFNYASEVGLSLLFPYMQFYFLNRHLIEHYFREWKQVGGHQPSMLNIGQAIHDSIPTPTISVSRKKQKIMPSTPLEIFDGPSPFHPQPVAAPLQPSLVAKRGSVSGSKGKKHKPVSK